MHHDTDEPFIDFCIECFYQVANKGFVVVKDDECYLDLGKIFSKYKNIENLIKGIHIYPDYHWGNILNNKKNLDDLYPLTKKQRVFTPIFQYKNMTFHMNPIFQSLLLPIYSSNISRCDYPTYLQSSSAGHSMTKWHFLRSVISLLLTETIPYEHLILHGNILGNDGTPMSKHKNNVIKPSDIFSIQNDKAFVRYVLIKSISQKDISLQIKLAESEYKKIKEKILILNLGGTIVNSSEVAVYVNRSIELLKAFDIKQSFEQFYLSVKKSQVSQASISQQDTTLGEILMLYNVFLQA